MTRNLFAFVMLLVGLATIQPASSAPADPLIGLWGTQLDLGRSLRGELVVRRGAEAWTASIAGRRATALIAKDAMRFDFGGRGQFRGRLTADGIHGFWIQPG